MDLILPAIIGLVAGTIGSLVAPWVNWGIEKQREKRKRREKFIDSWHIFIEDEFDLDTFRESAVFSQMKPYLSEEIIKKIDPLGVNIQGAIVFIKSSIGEDTIKKQLLDVITETEKKWDLT